MIFDEENYLFGQPNQSEQPIVTINRYKHTIQYTEPDVIKKLKFYKDNNIDVKFRLAFKQEYEFKGKIIDMEDDSNVSTSK